jgi:ubiquinone/menaquinone biosynthesis C-methylase UbiE
MPCGEAAAYENIADFYDDMVGDRASHIAFYTKLVGAGRTSVVDLARGTGRITAAMAAAARTKSPLAAHRVCGIDGSARMLARAGMLDPTIAWMKADIRHVPPMDPFDLAMCCFHSLQAFDRQGLTLVLSSARRLVRTGGQLAFDIYQPNRSAIAAAPRARIVCSYTDAHGRRLTVHERSSFDVGADVYSLHWTLCNTDAPDQDPRAECHFRFWQHDPAFVNAALHAAGFAVSERYGDLDRSPFDHTSKRQVLVCEAV